MARPAPRKSTGTKRTALVAKSSRSSGSSRRRREGQVVCIANGGYAASLEPRKIYAVLRDREADALGLLRVVDESGEDYLYPKRLFASVAVSRSVARALDLV